MPIPTLWQAVLFVGMLSVCATAPRAARPSDGTERRASSTPARHASARLRQLVERLGSDSFRRRSAAARDLLTAGEPAAEAIARWLDREDPEAVARAYRILSRLADSDDVPTILAAYRAIGRITGEDATTDTSGIPAPLRREFDAFLLRKCQSLRRRAGGIDKSVVTALSLRHCTGRGAVFLLQLKQLPNLQRLSLENSNATDRSVKHLEPLTTLRSLNLSATRVTDDALRVLARFSELESLYLSDTNVTDAGLEHIKSLPKLRVLWLDRADIGDAGIKHLRELESLRFLHLTGTSASDAAVRDLSQSRSRLRIVR